MNPLFQWIIAHTTAKAQTRRCPKCHRTQTVPKSKIQDTIPCESCGTPVTPKHITK
jgi:ribosomal protein S27E